MDEPKKRLSAKDAQKELERLRNKLLSITSSVQNLGVPVPEEKKPEPIPVKPEEPQKPTEPEPQKVDEPPVQQSEEVSKNFPLPERKSIQDNPDALSVALILTHVCQKTSSYDQDEDSLFTEEDLNLNDPELVSELPQKHPGYYFKPKKALLKDGVEQKLWSSFLSGAQKYQRVWSHLVSAAKSKTRLDAQVRSALEEYMPTLVYLSEELDDARRLLAWATLIRLHESGAKVGVNSFSITKYAHRLNNLLGDQ